MFFCMESQCYGTVSLVRVTVLLQLDLSRTIMKAPTFAIKRLYLYVAKRRYHGPGALRSTVYPKPYFGVTYDNGESRHE